MAYIISAFADEYSPNLDVQLKALKENGIPAIEPRNVSGTNISSLSDEQLAEMAKKYCENVSVKENAKGTLAEVLENLKDDEALVVAGSLYLASELRPMLMKFKGNPNSR